jgi:hypothetical protein
MQRLQRWTKDNLGHFVFSQLTHTVITAMILAALFFGAAQVDALDRMFAPLTQTTGTSFTTIYYQGRLANSSGNPINNTDPGLGMTFALYTEETGGSPIWSEPHTSVRVSNGLFSVKLGSVNALSADLLTGDRWLGITIGNDAEMAPREKLASVPYAMVAGEALTVPDGSIGADQIADDAVTLDKLGLAKYKFQRGGDDIVHYWGPSGQETELDLSTCAAGEWCCNAESMICYHHDSGVDAILEFNIEGTPSHACILVHNEDDRPVKSKGIYYATDGGKQSHTGGTTASFSREGVEGIPLSTHANYYWLCGW